jgi:hypothetical protein
MNVSVMKRGVEMSKKRAWLGRFAIPIPPAAGGAAMVVSKEVEAPQSTF